MEVPKIKPPKIFSTYVYDWIEENLAASFQCKANGDGEGEQIYGHLALYVAAYVLKIPKSIWIKRLNKVADATR